MSNNIVIIDYGIGNILSVQRGIEKCGGIATLSSDPEIIASAKKIILPGVGAFADGMAGIHERKLADPILTAVRSGAYLVGICLGMQMLLDESFEHGNTKGLGLVPGTVEAIPSFSGEKLARKIPHIGWNQLTQVNTGSEWNQSLLLNNSVGDSVYFVHSYTAKPTYKEHLLATSNYLDYSITAAVQKERVSGFQFHPEKSGEIGLKILRSLVNLST